MTTNKMSKLIIILRKIKQEIKSIYKILQKITAATYLELVVKIKDKLTPIYEEIEKSSLDKSLFSDFYLFVQEVNYFLDMITLNNLDDEGIQKWWAKEEEYISTLYYSLKDLDYSCLPLEV